MVEDGMVRKGEYVKGGGPEADKRRHGESEPPYERGRPVMRAEQRAAGRWMQGDGQDGKAIGASGSRA